MNTTFLTTKKQLSIAEQLVHHAGSPPAPPAAADYRASQQKTTQP
jgi:hypothetical protein